MRFDNLPKNLRPPTQDNELMVSIQKDDSELKEFLPYNQIEKTYEKIIIDKNLIYLLELDEDA